MVQEEGTPEEGPVNSVIQIKTEVGGQVRRVSGRGKKRRGEDDSVPPTSAASEDVDVKTDCDGDDSSTSQNTKRVKIDIQKEEPPEQQEQQDERIENDDNNSVDLSALIVEENDPILTGIQLIPHVQESIEDGVHGEILDCVKKEFTEILYDNRQTVHPVTSGLTFPVSVVAAGNQMIHFGHPGTSSTEPYHKIEHNYPKLVLVDSADQMEQIKSESGYASLEPPHTSPSNLINLTTINPHMTVKFDSNVQYFIVEEGSAEQQFETAVQAIVINHQDEASACAYKFEVAATPQKEKVSRLQWSEVAEIVPTQIEHVSVSHFELEPKQQLITISQDDEEKPEEIVSDLKEEEDSFDAEEEKPKKKKKTIRMRTGKEKEESSSMFNVVNDGRLLCTLCGTGKTFKNKNTLYNHRSMYHRNGGNPGAS